MANDKLTFGLNENTINRINSVFSQYPEINNVLIYGSRAQGNYRSGSDIDLTILGDITYQQLSQIETQLDDLLLPYTIDLSIFTQIDNPDLVAHVQHAGQVFYKNT
jgi:predicted nucleotidyltransferase